MSYESQLMAANYCATGRYELPEWTAPKPPPEPERSPEEVAKANREAIERAQRVESDESEIPF